jgi:hypothetical protein
MSNDLVSAINQYGFPIIAAMGLGYFVYYIWTWVTKEIKPVLSSAQKTLIALVDRIRMLDNDMIRLNTKLSMVLEQLGREGAVDKKKAQEVCDEFTSMSKQFDQTKVNHDNPEDTNKNNASGKSTGKKSRK